MQAGLLKVHTEDCVLYNTRCPFSTFALLITHYRVFYPSKIMGGVDANTVTSHTHCDLQSLKIIAVAVTASMFSTFER